MTRQYCGQFGKHDNLQVTVSLPIARDSASLPVAYQFYLPEDWEKDPIRPAKAGVPADVAFATKTQIALHQIEAILAAGVPRGVALRTRAGPPGASRHATRRTAPRGMAAGRMAGGRARAD